MSLWIKLNSGLDETRVVKSADGKSIKVISPKTAAQLMEADICTANSWALGMIKGFLLDNDEVPLVLPPGDNGVEEAASPSFLMGNSYVLKFLQLAKVIRVYSCFVDQESDRRLVSSGDEDVEVYEHLLVEEWCRSFDAMLDELPLAFINRGTGRIISLQNIVTMRDCLEQSPAFCAFCKELQGDETLGRPLSDAENAALRVGERHGFLNDLDEFFWCLPTACRKKNKSGGGGGSSREVKHSSPSSPALTDSSEGSESEWMTELERNPIIASSITHPEVYAHKNVVQDGRFKLLQSMDLVEDEREEEEEDSDGGEGEEEPVFGLAASESTRSSEKVLGDAIFSSLDFLRAEEPVPKDLSLFRANDPKGVYEHHPWADKDEAGNVLFSVCDKVRLRAQRLGLACFGRDFGGDYPDAKDDNDLARLRVNKSYFTCSWPEARLIFEGKSRSGRFHSRIADPQARNGYREEKTHRFLYEMLLRERASWPYGDIDCKLLKNQHMVGRADEMTWICIDFHIYMMKMLFNVDVEREDYLIMSSDYDAVAEDEEGLELAAGKISRHFICKKVMFRTQMAQRMFANHCYMHLQLLAEKHRNSPHELTEQEKRFCDFKIEDEKGNVVFPLDLTVFKRDQMFRPCFCSKAPAKFGIAPRPLVLAKINLHKAVKEQKMNHTDLFIYSLIQRPPDGVMPPDDSDLFVDYCVRAGEEIPLANYSMNKEMTGITAFHIGNPSDDMDGTGGSKKRKKMLTLNERAAKRMREAERSLQRLQSGNKYQRVSGSLAVILSDYVKKQDWAEPWTSQGRINAKCRVKYIRHKTRGTTGIFIQPKEGTIGGKGCHCEVRSVLQDVDMASHSNVPVEIKLKKAWNPELRQRMWCFMQGCFMSCSGTAEKRGLPSEIPLSWEVPLGLLEDLKLVVPQPKVEEEDLEV